MIINRVQALAIQDKARIWPEPDLIAALGSASEAEAIRQALIQEDTQTELYQKRDVALWRGADDLWRLIDQQPPDTQEQALRFLKTPTDGKVCAFCRLPDRDHELLEHKGGNYATFYLHALCRRPWYRWTKVAFRSKADAAPHWSQVLQIDRRTASRKEIEQAYKKLAQRFHPDKKGGSADRMTQLNQARDQALASPQAAK